MALSMKASTNSPKPSFLIGENYHLSLKQSMEDLLAETHKKTPNFSGFIDKFHSLMQAKFDPPLESIWVYTALSFRSRNFEKGDPLNRLSIINDLFQLVSSCSSPCNSSKSIALLAPIVFEVYKLVVEVLGKDSRKVNKRIKSLVEVIIGYISMCCCKGFSEESENIDMDLVIPVEDLVSIWIDRNVNLQSFLPLVSSEICGMISERGFNVNYLAGVVMVEAFLLKLCLDLRIGIEGIVLEKELKSWAVASISSFHNFYFFEMLTRMLLQPALPVTALVGPEDGNLLKNILYDAVILVEYTFLKSKTVHLSNEHVKGIAMTRLVVTLEAIELFSSDEKAGGVSGSSPKALIKRLLKLEKQGIKLFSNSILKYHAKLLVGDSKEVDEQSVTKVEEKKLEDDEPLFSLDDREDEKNEAMTAAYVAAARSMRLINDNSREKRKGSEGEEKEKIKYFKYDLSSKSKAAKEKVSVSGSDSGASDDDMSSDSEVDNPLV
ncbi:hypothetical protein Gorai_020284 [Gossypium raimondii]|uniref:Uncharacterized protein n=1 Tax=Gossypium raimondii TaxID=29730 RepID=A0A0D2PK48_GOSRA|nr:hypothetical protein B456_001G010900 [Gossypium raimondii]MBA0577980.1 hypothetical protein [Gossypium raimondii]